MHFTNLERQQDKPDDAPNEAYEDDERHAQGGHEASEQKMSVLLESDEEGFNRRHSALPAELAAAAHLSKSIASNLDVAGSLRKPSLVSSGERLRSINRKYTCGENTRFAPIVKWRAEGEVRFR